MLFRVVSGHTALLVTYVFLLPCLCFIRGPLKASTRVKAHPNQDRAHLLPPLPPW